MKAWMIFAFGAAVLAILLVTARELLDLAAHLAPGLTPAMLALAFAGWFAATLGPLALSAAVWRRARRSSRGWLTHLLFIPCAFALLQGGAALLLHAAGAPNGESLAGRTLTAAGALFVLTAAVHAAAAILLLTARTRRRPGAR